MICDDQGKILFFHHPDSWEMSEAEKCDCPAVCTTFSQQSRPLAQQARGWEAAVPAAGPGERWVPFVPLTCSANHTQHVLRARAQELLPLSSDTPQLVV